MKPPPDPEPAPPKIDDWLGTRDASRLLGYSVRQIYWLIDNGHLPAYKFGRVIRLRAADIVRYQRDSQ